MPTALEVFKRLTVKTDRAEKHIVDLNELVQRFQNSNPYTFTHNDDAQTGERSFYIHFANPFPPDMPAIIGDAIQNMRSALDHLATHLVDIGPGPVKTKRPYYPMFPSAKEYEAGKMGKIEGMAQAAIDAIDATEPYARGNGWILWDIHQLNNRDKHRLLIPAWSNLIAHTFPKSERLRLERKLNRVPLRSLKSFTGTGFINDGEKLLSMPISELEDHMELRITIAFREPEIVKGKPVVETLQSAAKLVRKIIDDFYAGGLL